jgi:hypothetical protein
MNDAIAATPSHTQRPLLAIHADLGPEGQNNRCRVMGSFRRKNKTQRGRRVAPGASAATIIQRTLDAAAASCRTDAGPAEAVA